MIWNFEHGALAEATVNHTYHYHSLLPAPGPRGSHASPQWASTEIEAPGLHHS